MKKILILVIIIILLPYVFDKAQFNGEVIKDSFTFPVGKLSPVSKASLIDYEGKSYSYSFFSPTSTQQLIYNLNLSSKHTSLDIIKEQGCTHLINGGFYDKLDQPIGLVIKDGLEVSPSQKNSLFNGFLSSTSSAIFNISTKKPSLKSEVAIQTGPLLVIDSTPQTLNLITDEYERRMVLAVSAEGVPYFIAVTQKGSDMEGPLLKDLPGLVTQIGVSEGMSFSDAINLDGGSASTLYSPDIHIKEMSTIGSYLCFK